MRTLAFGKYAALTLMVSVISLLSSCRNNDFDFEAAHGNLSESDVAYNDKFTELIGDIDPNHTWSTAQQSGVKVSIDIPGEHLLRIYTADPLTSTAFLLARYENIEGGTTHELKFDIPASKTSFCAVLDSAEYRISKIVELDSNGFASFIMSNEDESETRATRAAPSRDYSSCYTFRGDGDVYKFDCPNDIVDITNYDTTNSRSYKVVSGTTQIDCYKGNCDIYFTNGNYTIDKFYVAANTNVYLLPGANVTFTMNEGLNNNQSNVVMSIASNAKITVNKNISHGFKLYNQGTITCENFELYATGFTYNAGTINTGLTKVANYNSEFVNAGTLTCSGLNVEGTGKFQNTGTVNVSGTTLVNSNYCTWRNEGSYTTNNFTYNAGSTDVINNCKLKVNNLFEILLGDTDRNCFENNGSIDTKDFKMGIGYLLMGSKAVLKATGDAIMNITKAHYGIYGIGNDYAVFTAPEIKKIAENQGYCATYGGKLYVATPKHFAQGKSGDYPYYQIEGSAKLVQNAPAITSGGCSSGYTPSGTSSSAPDFGGGTGNTENSSSSINTSTSTTVDNPMHWIIACEDLPGETSDFDYNDIVFAVYHVGNTKTFQIKPLAAGGTLRAEILYRESANDFWNTASVNVDGNELSEIHQWITKNPSAPHTTMLNTDKGADVTKIINNIPVFTAEFANEVSMDNFADYFAVRVYQNNSSEETIIKSDVVENIPSTNSYKTAPRLICINSDDPTWQWMAERQPLYYHYTDFSNWASNKTTYTSWYQQIGSQEKQEFTIRWANTSNSNSSNNNSGNNNSGNGNADGSSTQQPTESNPIEEPETKNYVIYFWGYPVENNKREIGCNWTVDLSVKEISPDGIIDVTNDFTFKYNSTALYLNGNTAVACNTAEGTTSHVFEKAEGYANDITGNNETNATFKVISKKVITHPSTTDKQVNIWAEKKSNSSISTNPIILTIKGQDGRDDEVYYEGVNWSFSGMVDGHQKNGDYLGRGQSNNEFNTLSQNYDTNTKGVVKAIQDNSGKTIEWNVNVIPHILTGTTTLCDYEFSLKDNSTHNVKNVGDFTWHKVNPGSEIEVLYTLHDNGNGTKCSLRLSTTWCQDFVSFGEEAQRKQDTYTFRYTLTQEILDKLQEQGFSVRGDGTVKKVYLINKPR